MGEKEIGSAGFAETFLAPGVGLNKRLDRIDGLFDWARFGALLSSVRSAKGRRGYPSLALFKALLLQQWYGLSDPGLEEALGDRLSFRRFCGFSLSDETPDETTFVRFRQALVFRGMSDLLLAEVNEQLSSSGLMLKTGTLIDASLVRSAVKQPSRHAGALSDRDRDANWTKQYNRAHFGYKAHVAMDEGSCLIRRAVLTPAKVYESEVADALIIGDEAAVYADKAYEKRARRQALKARGCKDRIMHRAHKNRALTAWQQRRNKLISPIRCQVEKLFGTLKRCYGYRRARYLGLQRNDNHLQLLCIALNMRRAEVLTT